MLAQSAVAQLNSPRLGSDISLFVDGGAETAVLPVIAETAGSDLLTYNFASNEIRFSAGVLAPSYDDPLFCFDMGTPSSPVTIEMKDPNGHVVVDNFELGTSLQYVLAAPSSLVIEPTLDQQCFYRSSQGVFGLFGQEFAGDPEPQGLISRDRFEPDLSMSLAFQGVPQFATPGQTISYDLVLTNTGSGDFNEIALQELFPENLGVYAAALTGTEISCTPSGGAVCPTIGTESFLRFKNPGAGVDIPAGGSLTFGIQRSIDGASTTGEDIHLHAGALADPVATGVPFAVDEAVITVIGQSAGLNVSATDATADSFSTTGDAGDDAQITVTVLDASQNPVPFEPVSIDSPGGLTITSPTSGTSDANGEVVFTATAQDADVYTISFTSGTLSGNGNVSILAGVPASFFLQEPIPPAVADGQDAVEIQILVEDQYTNAVPSAQVDVTDDDGLVSLPPNQFTDVDGIAAFYPTATTAGTYEPVFSILGVGSTPATVTFEAGAPDDLEFTLQPPSPVVADADFDVSLQVVDSEGNFVGSDQDTFVTLNLQQNGSTIRNLTSGSVTNGTVTFTVNSIGSADIGSNYRIQAVASGTGFFGANSDTFDIVAPPQ